MSSEHKYGYEDGAMGCEEDSKCCLCVPIDKGVKVFGLINILFAIGTGFVAYEAYSIGIILFIFFGTASVFYILGSVLFLKLFLKDN